MEVSVAVVITVIGGIALLVGIFGGGIKLERIEIPPIHPIIRIISSIVGVALIALAISLSAPEQIGASQQSSQPTSKPSTSVCNSKGDIPPLPVSPSSGCILVVEWWIPPAVDNEHCGIFITTNTVDVSIEAIGTWYYIYPNRVDSHIKEFQQGNPNCTIDDRR